MTDGLWAVGDITGRGAFTHMAMYQSAIAVAAILGERPTPVAYHAVPRVTFADPEIGSVGLTEQQARDQGLRLRVGTAQLPSSARGWIHKTGNDGFVKLVEMPSGGCWWARPAPAQPAARCWARSSWPCMRRSRPAPYGP